MNNVSKKMRRYLELTVTLILKRDSNCCFYMMKNKKALQRMKKKVSQ